MADAPTAVVTGAYGFIGRAVAGRLLDDGLDVRTLTNHPERDPFDGAVAHHPYAFDDPAALVEFLAGADVLVNTYWERLPGPDGTFDGAVANTRTLVEATVSAGVERLVHLSVANPDPGIPYYEGKAAAEAVVREAGPAHAIVRPTLVFGEGDLLIAQMAWLLRRLPLFGLPAGGRAPVRPIHVGDVADVVVEQVRSTESDTMAVAGPETMTFRALLSHLRDAMGARCLLVPMPARLSYVGIEALEWWLDDLLLTWPELRGLLEGRLATGGPAAGDTPFGEWAADHADALGREYASFSERYG